MKTGIITKPSAWLSSVSGGGHTDELFMGWAVGILKEEGEWMQVVTHYGYRGCLKKGSGGRKRKRPAETGADRKNARNHKSVYRCHGRSRRTQPYPLYAAPRQFCVGAAKVRKWIPQDSPAGSDRRLYTRSFLQGQERR